MEWRYTNSNSRLIKSAAIQSVPMCKSLYAGCVAIVLVCTSGCQQRTAVENSASTSRILSEVKSDQHLNAAVERLSKVSTFAFGGVGFAGVESQGEADYKIVMSQPRDVAVAVFEKLFADGSTEARCYALTGMKKLSATRFKEILPIARKSSDKVQVMRGCIMSHEPMRAVAQQIAEGEFQSRFK